jgi:hypothetical protein
MDISVIPVGVDLTRNGGELPANSPQFRKTASAHGRS